MLDPYRQGMKNRTALTILAGAVVVTSSVGALAGCLSPNDEGSAPGGTGGLGAAPTASAPATPASTSPAPAQTTPAGRPTTTRPATTPPVATGPKIVYFRIAQKPRCPQGTSEFPVEGVPVILEWKVTGAKQVTLSVDGPGVYDTYEATGTATLAFPCGGEPGESVTHTYLLKTIGGQPVRSKKLTASAEVYEVASV
ncbi:hypothetical protein Pa4123_01190 [Phytohabitans aurantiacus]|uniref:Lipoprotein n=2 Tax=Phytohabitans aurantiacus TaxID=3016789 RepID=A0ABQ5QL11_9ACTN|nr:hypothetical protein Pa4123_01190 [Phytohabitans aurantiacus]